MASRSIGLSKITRPRVGYAYPRDRLLERLREGGHESVWISAPAGAGKTTLAATYVEASKLRCLWYRFERGDSDPASFFHYLNLAARKAAPRARFNLKPLTPEYAFGLTTFSRRFFEQLFACLRSPALLVFDNHHELDPASPVHECLAEAIGLTPEGTRVIVVSREDPPPPFARLRANVALTLVQFEDLKLTQSESLEIARRLQGGELTADAREALLEIARKADGWAAGLVLLLEANRVSSRRRTVRELDRDALFDYFANQVFDEAAPETRELLMLSALLPVMSGKTLETLTGDARAEQRLRELLRRNYFVSRSTGSPPTYEYHALFREFLLERLARARTPAQLLEARRDAARALLETGQDVAAVDLLLLAEAWPEAVAAMLRLAPELAAQGRLQALHRWLVALPERCLTGSSWLSYWLACALAGLDSVRALKCLETAYEGFSRSSDAAGQYLAFADAVQLTWMTGWDLTPIDGWLARFDELDAARVAMPSIDIEARVLTSLLMGAYLRRFGDSRVPKWLERAREILDDVPAPVPRAALFASLGWHYYYGLGAYHVWLRELSALLEAERPDAPPLYYLYLWVSMAFGRFYAGEFDEALGAADRGLALADATGVHVADGQLAGVRAKAALCLGDREAADAALDRMAAALEGRPDGYTKSFETGVRAWRHLLDPNGGPEALELARESVRVADRAGAAYPSGACRYVLAHALLEAGMEEEGLRYLEESRIRWAGGEHQHQAFQYDLTKAWLALRRGERDSAIEALRLGLARGERMGYGAPIASRPSFLHPLLRFALEARLHVEYVQRLILGARLVPANPADLPSAWPVPVRIQALDGFAVALFGAPLDAGPLQRNRPLELLKALIALGGANVAQERLAGAVWPDGSGDRAIAALHTTLHRLRKLLRREDAVLVKDGHVSLNDRVVWVDVWAAEALLERLERALADTHADPAMLRELERRLVGVYEGPFLEFEAERPWALRLRDELHERVVAACVAIGQRWQEVGDNDRALEAFKSALRLEPLSEKLHRTIMRVHADNGEFAEALAVYERCKRTLSVNFGVPPGLATAGLYESIRKGLAEP